MADEIVAIYRAEVEQYRKNVESLILSLGRLDAAQNKATQSASTAFTKVDAASSVVGKNIDSTTQKVVQLEKAEEKAGRTAVVEFGKAGKAVNNFAANTNNADKSLNNMDNGVLSLTTNLRKMAAAIGITFTIDKVVAFAKESINVAAAAEGVERAFKRIGSPQLLDGLRRATRGTVTDLNLMTTAIQASNFKIPLEELATYLKFATQRANETGKSVDYMVESILTGVGRGSIEVWDNLGFSLGEVRKHLNGVAVESLSVGERAKLMSTLVNAELEKMGVQADTTADKIAKITAELENLKVEAGKQLVSVANALFGDERAFETQVKGTIEYATAIRNAGQIIRDDYERTLRVVEGRADREKVLAEEAKVRETQLANLRTQLSNKTSKEVIEDDKLREFLLTKAIENAVGLDIINRRSAKENLRIFNEDRKNRITQVGVLQEQIRTIENLGKVQEEEGEVVKEQIKNVFYYTQAIKALKDKLEEEGTTRERIKEIIKEIPPLQEELARLLGEETEATKKAREEVEKLAKAEEDRWKALEAQADDRLKKHFEVDQFIADRTARGLREQMELDKQAEVIKGANAEATALSIGMSEEHILAIRQASIDEQLRIEADYRAKIQEMEDESVEATVKAEADKNAARKDATAKMYEDMAAAVKTYGAIAMQINSLISEASRIETEKELMALETALEAGQITREQYDQERRRLLSKQAADEKSANIFAAIISTAAAVADALPNIPLSIIAAALGAAQIAVIASQPIPKFAKGVINLQGEGTSTSDSIHAKLSKGESVMTARETKEHMPILTAIRKGTLEKLIHDTYVAPAINAAMFNGFQDIGKSADLNGITAKLSDHNIIAAMDRNRQATTYGLAMIAEEIRTGKSKNRRGYA
jgi:hypothetical protein